MDTLALSCDVHDNRLPLEPVLRDLEELQITRFFCLGDLVGHSADPHGVIDLIRLRNIETILGNYDEGIGWETGDCGCFYADDEARRIGDASYVFTLAAVTAECRAYLRSLPRELHIELADKKIHLVYGSPRSINEYLLRDRDERAFLRLARTETDDVLGSAPRGLIEMDVVRVTCDVEAAAHAVIAAGLPVALAEMLRNGH